MKGIGGLWRGLPAAGLLMMLVTGCASANRWNADPWNYNATSGYPLVGRGAGEVPVSVWEPVDPGDAAPWPSPSALDLPFNGATGYPYLTPGTARPSAAE